MDRRKDTPGQCAKLPMDYLKLVEDVFNKNFAKLLLVEKGARERFIVHGEVYPDELLLCISLRNPKNLRGVTCYTSVDYPAAKFRKEGSSVPTSASEAVQHSVNTCVDAAASFFNTFFEEGRPLDYDLEYRQNWTPIDIDKTTQVFMRINRDNPDLDHEADAILEQADDKDKKKKLH